MNKKKSMRLLSFLMSLMMVLALVGTPVYAADTNESAVELTSEVSTDETEEESEDENSEESAEEAAETPAESETDEDETGEASEEVEETTDESLSAEDVQAMIDALPDAEDIAADNAADVESQLDAIDAARAEIGEAADTLDYTKYDAAIVALEAIYASEASEDEDFDEFVPDVELPNGAVRSDRIAAASVASAVEDIETANVVSIDGDTTNTYSTVTDAIDAITSTGTITLTGDLSEGSITIPSGKDITLNLNGNTLTLTGCTTYTDTLGTFRVSLLNQGDLIVENGTIQGNGTYTTDQGSFWVNNTIVNTGTLTINSGVTVNGQVNTITNVGGSVTTSGDITVAYYNAIATYGGSITVNGGSLTAMSSTYYGCAITIFGRNYDSTCGTEVAATVTINDGTINAYCYDFSTNNLYSGDSCLNIYGGTINSVFCCIYWPTPGTITIGSTTSTSDATPYLKNTGGSGIVICCGTLNVYSGTIEATYAATASTPFDSITWAANYRASSGMTGLADAISIIANRSANYAQYALEVNLEGGTFISASNYAVRYANCNAASDLDSTDTEQTISVELSGGTYEGGVTTDGTAVAAVDASCEYTDTSNISTLTITGGTYSSDVSDYTASATTVITNSDGTTTVVNGSYVAAIGDTYYESLYKASASATDGDTITLIADVGTENGEADDYFRADGGKILILDLNGHSIYANSLSETGNKKTAILVTGSAELTIKDSSKSGGVVTTSGSRAVWMISGKLTIEAESYTWTGADNAIYVASQASSYEVGSKETLLMIECGTFYGKNAVAIKNDKGDTVINGGIFVGYSEDTLKAIAVAGGSGSETGTVTITAGYFAGSLSPQGSAFTISGGYYLYGISTSEATFSTGMSCISLGSETVEDGITKTAYAYKVDYYTFSYGYIASDGSYVTKGSSNSISALYSELNEMSVDGVDISDIFVQLHKDYLTTGTFDVSSITEYTKITIDLNGFALSTTATSAAAITVQPNYTVTIVDSSGDDSGTVSAVSSSPYGTIKNRGGNLTIAGGTFINTESGLVVNNNGNAPEVIDAETTITGGNFEGTADGNMFYAYTGSTLSIEGGYFAYDPSDSGYIAEGYAVYESGDDTYPYAVLNGVAASIGTTYYGTLQAAIDAASSDATVTLLKDVTEDVVIESSQTITIDLAGHKITNSTSHTIINYGTLTIEDSTGNGVVDNVTHGKGALVNYGTATLLGGTYERSLEAGTSSSNNGGNSWYTLKNYGTLTVGTEGSDTCSVVVKNNGAYSSCVANGYQNTSDKNSAQAITGTDVTPIMYIYGGTFSGGIATIKNDDNAVLTISGGEFSNSNQDVIQNHSTATISAGTFTATGNAYTIYNCGCDADIDVGQLTIEGGTFTSEEYVLVEVSTANTSSVTISEGSFTGTIWTSSGSVADWAISGGTYSEEVDPEYCTVGYTPVSYEDDTYRVTEFNIGISTSDDENIAATVISEASGILVVKTSASSYGTEAYPTTSRTYTTDTDSNNSGKYIFAGWYTDAECTGACTSDMWNSDSQADYYYAKFVDADVLTVRGIVTYGSAEDKDEETNYWRFATGLDSFNYNYIGFQVKLGDATEATELVGKCYTKYTVTGADNYVFTPSMFGSSVYIATNVISDTSATTCTVRAYWTTMDGTSVYSNWYSYSIPSGGYVLTETTVAE